MSSERDLILQAQSGDTVAFEQLVNAHAPYVYNVALRTLGNSAESQDITQETFIRVWRSLKNYRGDAQFRTWLYRIVTNLCYNRLPRLKSELTALGIGDELELHDHSQQVESVLVDDDRRQLVHAAIDDLPESYRLLISLRHLQGMSYAEIAAATDLPLGTVKTGIFRARRELKAILLQQAI